MHVLRAACCVLGHRRRCQHCCRHHTWQAAARCTAAGVCATWSQNTCAALHACGPVAMRGLPITPAQTLGLASPSCSISSEGMLYLVMHVYSVQVRAGVPRADRHPVLLVSPYTAYRYGIRDEHRSRDAGPLTTPIAHSVFLSTPGQAGRGRHGCAEPEVPLKFVRVHQGPEVTVNRGGWGLARSSLPAWQQCRCTFAPCGPLQCMLPPSTRSMPHLLHLSLLPRLPLTQPDLHTPPHAIRAPRRILHSTRSTRSTETSIAGMRPIPQSHQRPEGTLFRPLHSRLLRPLARPQARPRHRPTVPSVCILPTSLWCGRPRSCRRRYRLVFGPATSRSGRTWTSEP